jgi:hypothetical protein
MGTLCAFDRSDVTAPYWRASSGSPGRCLAVSFFFLCGGAMLAADHIVLPLRQLRLFDRRLGLSGFGLSLFFGRDIPSIKKPPKGRPMRVKNCCHLCEFLAQYPQCGRNIQRVPGAVCVLALLHNSCRDGRICRAILSHAAVEQVVCLTVKLAIRGNEMVNALCHGCDLSAH